MNDGHRLYASNSVTEMLYFRKRAYQRNMFKAWIITLAAGAIILAALVFFFDGQVTETVRIDTGRFRLDPFKGFSEDIPTGYPGGDLAGSPTSEIRGGFGGFNGYKIGGLKQRVAVKKYRPSKTIIDGAPETGVLSPGDINETGGKAFGFSGNFESGGGYDDGLPEVTINTGRVWGLPRNPGADINDLSSKKLAIRLAGVRYPKKGFGIDGLARIFVAIDPGGNIDSLEILYESPAGYDFAEALKEAIYQSYFFPPKINGEKRGATVIFTHVFCEDCPRETVISGNVEIYGPGAK